MASLSLPFAPTTQRYDVTKNAGANKLIVDTGTSVLGANSVFSGRHSGDQKSESRAMRYNRILRLVPILGCKRNVSRKGGFEIPKSGTCRDLFNPFEFR
jgi:hypothetical protein